MRVPFRRWSRRRWLVTGGIAVAVVAVAAVVALLALGFLVRQWRERYARDHGFEMLTRAHEFRTDNGRWPSDEVECYGAELPPFDAWGTPLRLRVEMSGAEMDGEAELLAWSAGFDRRWETDDDWVVACEPSDAASRTGLRTRPR